MYPIEKDRCCSIALGVPTATNSQTDGEAHLPSMSAIPGSLVVVAGGANLDYIGTSEARLIHRVSNPGTINESAGGVARNVAENLARLGVHVELISVFGDDAAGQRLMDVCRGAGIGLDGSLVVAGQTARYLAINDDSNDLSEAVSDMRILRKLTPDAIESPSRARLIRSADVVVADTNLSGETLERLVQIAKAPLVVDPVSPAKLENVRPVLGGISVIKPNEHEAELLTGITIGDLADAETAARAFIDMGLRSAFVTLGSHGFAWAETGASGTSLAPEFAPLNTSGAGDAFLAGVVYAMLAGAGAETQAKLGSCLSLLAMSSDQTVNPQQRSDDVLRLMSTYYPETEVY
jgi:pseudouridine kinase